MASPLCAQPAANLVPNGTFERGTQGWSAVVGPYGRSQPNWAGAGTKAAVVTAPAHGGSKALRLDARGLSHEVDAYSSPFLVTASHGYRLSSFVWQLAGQAG